MDLHLVAVLQILQSCERTGLIQGIPDMSGQNGVSIPGGEGRAIEPAGVLVEPFHIPAAVFEGNSHNGHFHIQLGNLKPKSGWSIRLICRLRGECSHFVHREASFR